MKQRKLTPQEANRLAVQMQVLRIKLVEFSLKYTFDGKSVLWDAVIDNHTLEREKSRLTELYRIKTLFESGEFRNLPYLPSGGSRVEKIKEHYLRDSGTVNFVEVKQSSHGKSVVNHLWNKRTIKRAIRKKQQASNRIVKRTKSKQHDTKKKG